MNKIFTKVCAVIFICLIPCLQSAEGLSEPLLGEGRGRKSYSSFKSGEFSPFSLTNNDQSRYYIRREYRKSEIKTKIEPTTTVEINTPATTKIKQIIEEMDAFALRTIALEIEKHSSSASSSDDSDTQETEVFTESRCASILYCLLPNWLFYWLYPNNQ